MRGYSSNAGVRVSLREPLALASTLNRKHENQDEVLSLSPGRLIYRAHAPRRPRRLKACMKQVVGGAFCEIRKIVQENEIIRALNEESQKCVYEPLKRQRYDDEKLEKAAARIVKMLQELLDDKVTRYIDAIVQKLFHFATQLTWDIRKNNCQKFCEVILDYDIFGSFIPMTHTSKYSIPEDPLYLVSFVCPSGSYDGLPTKVRPKSKKMAPNGLTEEYLFRFYKYGHHDDSDILDTLLEYWHDWGAFGGTIFPHQNLFPWDCTQACRTGNYTTSQTDLKCGGCGVLRHVWAFPFDSWSIVQLHMFRDRRFYTPEVEEARTLSDTEWMRNRLDVLDALQALNVVAAALVKTKEFRSSCRWVNIIHPPTNRETSAEKEIIKYISRRDRVKLAGIFRAQPESHYFEQGKYHDCTLAPWADLVRPDQIELYLKTRDYRANDLDDIRDLYKKSFSPKSGLGPGPARDPFEPAVPGMTELTQEEALSNLSQNSSTLREVKINSTLLNSPRNLKIPLMSQSMVITQLGTDQGTWEDSQLWQGDTNATQIWRARKDQDKDFLWLEAMMSNIDGLRRIAPLPEHSTDSDTDDTASFQDDESLDNTLEDYLLRLPEGVPCNSNIQSQIHHGDIQPPETPMVRVEESSPVETTEASAFCVEEVEAETATESEELGQETRSSFDNQTSTRAYLKDILKPFKRSMEYFKEYKTRHSNTQVETVPDARFKKILRSFKEKIQRPTRHKNSGAHFQSDQVRSRLNNPVMSSSYTYTPSYRVYSPPARVYTPPPREYTPLSTWTPTFAATAPPQMLLN